MEESLFAYSMCQSDQGWTWRLWDETGDVVAAGEAPDETSAHHRLQEAFERTRSAPVTAIGEARPFASTFAARPPGATSLGPAPETALGSRA